MSDITNPSTDVVWHGAEAIAQGMFGDASQKNVRRVRHYVTQGTLPFFRLRSSICLRASAWKRRVEELEREAAQADTEAA